MTGRKHDITEVSFVVDIYDGQIYALFSNGFNSIADCRRGIKGKSKGTTRWEDEEAANPS